MIITGAVSEGIRSVIVYPLETYIKNKHYMVGATCEANV